MWDQFMKFDNGDVHRVFQGGRSRSANVQDLCDDWFIQAGNEFPGGFFKSETVYHRPTNSFWVVLDYNELSEIMALVPAADFDKGLYVNKRGALVGDVEHCIEVLN